MEKITIFFKRNKTKIVALGILVIVGSIHIVKKYKADKDNDRIISQEQENIDKTLGIGS